MAERVNADGSVTGQIAVHNPTEQGCSVAGGMPKVQMLDSAGRPITTIVLPEAGAAAPVVLVAGDPSSWASFRFDFAQRHIDDPAQSGCPTSASLAVSPPEGTSTVVVLASFEAWSRPCGKVGVGAYYAGLAAP